MRETASPELSQRTTLRVGGTAIAELLLERREDVECLPEKLRALGGHALALGAGSNILARDGALPLVLVRPCLPDGPEIIGSEDGKILVRAGAGVPMPRMLRFCLTHGLCGLEGLAGIPGTVGGAVAMNAGSYGTETGDAVQVVEAVIGNDIRHCTASELEFGYRNMRITGCSDDFIVLNATFALTKAERDGISKAMRHNFFEKKSKQPVTAWSAGCVFKNPSPQMPAGKLLDLAGCKGKKFHGMAFSSLHANFLINEGTGTASAALDLLQEAQEAVWRVFGIQLEPEVRIVPCPLS